MRCWSCAGFVVPALLLIATGFTCNAVLAVLLIIAAVAFLGISFAGWSVNHLDLAPPYAGLNRHVVSFLYSEKHRVPTVCVSISTLGIMQSSESRHWFISVVSSLCCYLSGFCRESFSFC